MHLYMTMYEMQGFSIFLLNKAQFLWAINLNPKRSVFYSPHFKSQLPCFIAFILLCGNFSSIAQTKKGPGSFEVLYDEPYSINKLFVHFVPVIADIYLTNPNVSFGFEVNYLPGKKLDYEFSMRTSYGQRFDVMRDLAETNRTTDNKTIPFRWLQMGATYHIKDRERDGNAKIIPYTKRTKPYSFDTYNYFDVPCLVREVWGARLGIYDYQSTVDISNTMIRQNVELVSQDGNVLTRTTRERVYSTMAVTGIYVGGSYSTIRNVVVKPEGGSGTAYKNSGSDQILTTYLDLMVAPRIVLDNIQDGPLVYSTAPMKLNNLGWRAGLDIMHNRSLHWSFGLEIGSHTGLSRRGGFFMGRIAFPVMAFTIDKRLNK